MRVKSPIGEYDYRVTGVRIKREGVEVEGSLGQWQTTMVVERQDLTPLLRVGAVLGWLVLAVRLLR